MKKMFVSLLLLLTTGAALSQSTPVPLTPLQVTVSPTLVTITGGAAPVTIPVPSNCPSQPLSTSNTIACPAGTTGSWIQTTSYTSVPAPACWTPILSPTSAPPGACTTPPVVTPSASCNGVVISNGKSNWPGNFNYGAIIETDGQTAPDGSIAVKFTATALPSGGGGFLPWCQNPLGSVHVFDTTPYKFINLTLMATRPSQAWQLVQPDTAPPGDNPVPGTVSLNIGVSGQVPINAWVTYKFALGAGGIGLVPGQNIWKFGVQDQMYWVAGQNAAASALGAGNVWYAKDIHYSAN